jgi:hypothetical protein
MRCRAGAIRPPIQTHEAAMPARGSIFRRLHGLGRAALLGAALLAAPSCSRFRPGEHDEAPRVQIVFTNESLEQADVFAVSPGGETVRMGTVMAGRTETLDVPSQFVTRGSVNIAARLLTRTGVLRTGPLTINAGDRLQIRLPLSANTLSVLPAG